MQNKTLLQSYKNDLNFLKMRKILKRRKNEFRLCAESVIQWTDSGRKSGKLPWGHHIHVRKTSPRVSARQSAARRTTLFEVIKKYKKYLGEERRGRKKGEMMRCGQCHISIFRLGSIAQARFGEVRFSEQETDLERKSLTFIYITQTFSTGNSWGSICLLLVLSYSLRVFGHMFKSRHFSFPFFFGLFLSFSKRDEIFGSPRFGSHQAPFSSTSQNRTQHFQYFIIILCHL